MVETSLFFFNEYWHTHTHTHDTGGKNETCRCNSSSVSLKIYWGRGYVCLEGVKVVGSGLTM